MTLQLFVKTLNTRLIIRLIFALLFLILSFQTLACLYDINLFEALQKWNAEGANATYPMLEKNGLTIGSLITYKYYTVASYFIAIPIGILIAMRTIATTKSQRACILFFGLVLMLELRLTGHGFIYQELLLKTPGKFFNSLFAYLLLTGLIQLILGLLILKKWDNILVDFKSINA